MDSYVGCSWKQADRWCNKYQRMYDGNRRRVFAGVNHWNLNLDGSTHSKKERLCGFGYSWENQESAYTDVQTIKPTQYLLLPEDECLSCVSRLIAQRKQERVAAYKHLLKKKK